jgi:curved DNA-binding protein CbpA
VGFAPERKIMTTFYDVLGARPDDDAEALRAAFRKAAKANHPDLHAEDPYATIRFRQIAQAYEILRDAERRATYDRMLRYQYRWLRVFSYPMRSIVFDAVAAVGLAVSLAGGYMTYVHFSRTPTELLAGPPARRAAGGRPAVPISANKPDDRLEYAAGRAPEPPAGPEAAALNSDAALVTNAAVSAQQADPKSLAKRSDDSGGTEMHDQDNARLVKALSSSRESDSVGKSSPSDFATADDKGDMKGPDDLNLNAKDAKVPDRKLPETKMPRRARMAARPTSRTNFEQASLENRNSCSGSQSCSRDVPPLFGVGF